MARLLLVHGSNHGSWCWREVVPLLARRGHEVVTVDLPSVARDPDGLAGVTLEDDAAAIVARLEQPTVLVGHSAAGYAITRAAAMAPAGVSALVYLCAYVPRPGARLSDLAREAPGQPLANALEIDRARRAYRFREAALAANLYDDCPADVLAFARPRLGWQATRAQSEPVAPVPQTHSHYIVCARDRTIPPAQQRDMAAAVPPGHVHELATGHSPFFAAPGDLAELLDRIVAGK